MTLKEEAKRAELLCGKVVETILRHRPKEMVVQFTDRTRLFAHISGTSLELSITKENV